jgi:hypothetical protein
MASAGVHAIWAAIWAAIWMLSSSGAIADDRRDTPLPSFLGADSLKALEAARAEREAEKSRQAPAAVPSVAAPAQPARPDRRKAQEEEAKRRAETMRRLAPDGGIKRVSPEETRLIEAEDAAKARADRRSQEAAAGNAQSAGTMTLEQEAKSIGSSAAALGDAAAQMKALIGDDASRSAPPPALPAQSISLMEKLPAPAEVKPPAEAPSPPQKPGRSPGGKLSDPLPAGAAPAAAGTAGCGTAQIAAASVAGGRMRIDIDSGCRGGESVQVTYGAVKFERALDKAGRLAFTLDLFQGREPEIAVQFQDGTRTAVAAKSDDLDKVSKLAVMWRTPVNLDLHAFEYTARLGANGHVWAGQPGSVETAQTQAAADARGRGFLSFQSDASTPGDKVEVYTFWHVPGQDGGAVTLAVDHETRGATPKAETCGAGKLASVEMHVWRLVRGADLETEERMLASVPCGSELPAEVRYNPDSMPHLRVR